MKVNCQLMIIQGGTQQRLSVLLDKLLNISPVLVAYKYNTALFKKLFVTQQSPLVVVIFRSKKKVSLQRYCTDYCGMRGTCLYITHYLMISNFRCNAFVCCVWSVLNWRISFTSIKKGLRWTQQKSKKLSCVESFINKTLTLTMTSLG